MVPFIVITWTSACADKTASMITAPLANVSYHPLMPPSQPVIRIHCGSSLGRSEHLPLVVVDGKVIGMQPDSTVNYEEASAFFQKLEPEEIETIEVLKGSAAIARYGPAAHRGVLVISRAKRASAAPLSSAPR